MEQKTKILSLLGIIASGVIQLLGGWDLALQTLVLFMAVDVITGWVLGIINKSPHSCNGKLESRASFKGLCRKGLILLVVLIATWLDYLTGTDFVRDAVIVAFVANEAISIIENVELAGVKIPSALKKAIDAIAEEEGENENE